MSVTAGTSATPTCSLKVATDVLDTRDQHPALEQQAANNSRDDFVRDRDGLLIDATLNVGGDRDRQAAVLKAFLDDENVRARASQLSPASA